MTFRKLRIAWSALCAIACVLLIVLWVRSYWRRDQFSVMLPSSQKLGAISLQGQFALGKVNSPASTLISFTESRPVDDYLDDLSRTTGVPNEELTRPPWVPWVCPNCFLNVPHWYLAMPLGGVAMIPWIRWKWRFTLRTLLIATTLVAVVLSLVAWLR